MILLFISLFIMPKFNQSIDFSQWDKMHLCKSNERFIHDEFVSECMTEIMYQDYFNNWYYEDKK